MDEVENKEVVEQIPTATDETPEVHAKVEEKVESEVPQESVGIRALRKRNDELAKELRRQRQIVEELQAQTQKPKEADELDTVADDDYIPVGKVKRLIAREVQKTAAQEAEKLIQRKEQSQFMERLKSQFSDFEDVVTPEALALLEEQEPDLAASIAEIKDSYKIGLQSYKYIKAFGLQSQVPQARRQKEVEKKLEQNAKTVQSPQAYDKRPMAQAFKMGETEKKALYEEMMRYASMV